MAGETMFVELTVALRVSKVGFLQSSSDNLMLQK